MDKNLGANSFYEQINDSIKKAENGEPVFPEGEKVEISCDLWPNENCEDTVLFGYAHTARKATNCAGYDAYLLITLGPFDEASLSRKIIDGQWYWIEGSSRMPPVKVFIKLHGDQTL